MGHRWPESIRGGPNLGRQHDKGLRILTIKFNIKDSLSVGEIVLLQIVVEASFGGAEIGDSSTDTLELR